MTFHFSSTEKSDEYRNSPTTLEAAFVPIVPSQIDPHPTITLNGESHLNPVFAEQNFFPSFFRSGHQLPSARPFSSRHVGGASSAGRYISSTKSPFDETILGSGDFTVLRGGTFYGDGEKKRRPNHDYFGSGSSFYESANTGRPFALPLESPHYSDDPFANFKDFADITAGIDSDFSHFVIVYANKNLTNAKHEPRNILEQLQLIEQEKREEGNGKQHTETSTTSRIEPKKLSKFKTKLFLMNLTKEPKKKEATKKTLASSQLSSDYTDPLVADS